MKIIISSLFFTFLIGNTFAQKAKVQTAWRALNDYETTEKDKKPDIKYLDKAKEAIDAALLNPDTKNQGKTHTYKAQISYAYYRYNLDAERKKLEGATQDKNEKEMLAYGNTPVSDFESAMDAVAKINELDPKYMETITQGITKGAGGLSEEDAKFAILVQQLVMGSGNIAQGKYKAKKYDEAADYFYKTGFINTLVLKTKDTSNFYNACVAAAKSKNMVKVLDYNTKMVDLKIASAYNYESIYNVKLGGGDTTAALTVLSKGRAALPNDMTLMNIETNYFLANGKQQEALSNLKASIDKDPKNALLYLVTGNIYDNLANPKDKNSGKELDKPANFDELFKNAETHYLKAIEFSGNNKELAYNSLYNTGAMYNNYGGYIQNRKPEKITDVVKMQKENETKSQEYYKKAVPFLEKALDLKPDDKATMVALRKLYLLTNNEAKAKEMNEKIKTGK